MCFFGGAKAAPAPKKPEFEDAPPVVTGEQTGVDKPKNTAKATEKLRMMRKKKVKEVLDSDQESLEGHDLRQKLKRWLLLEKQ